MSSSTVEKPRAHACSPSSPGPAAPPVAACDASRTSGPIADLLTANLTRYIKETIERGRYVVGSDPDCSSGQMEQKDGRLVMALHLWDQQFAYAIDRGAPSVDQKLASANAACARIVEIYQGQGWSVNAAAKPYVPSGHDWGRFILSVNMTRPLIP